MPSQHAHLYGSRWQKARAGYLKKHPWCTPCAKAGRGVRATVVHHKVPHRGDKALFWDSSNWEPRCTTCHNDAEGPEKTGRKETYRGCGPDGLPLDPRHHWRHGGEG